MWVWFLVGYVFPNGYTFWLAYSLWRNKSTPVKEETWWQMFLLFFCGIHFGGFMSLLVSATRNAGWKKNLWLLVHLVSLSIFYPGSFSFLICYPLYDLYDCLMSPNFVNVNWFWRLSEAWHSRRPSLVETVKLLLDEHSWGVRKALAEVRCLLYVHMFLLNLIEWIISSATFFLISDCFSVLVDCCYGFSLLLDWSVWRALCWFWTATD